MMIYKLEADTWQDKVEEIAILACDGDIVFVPNIKAMNKVMKRLIEIKPGVMIYVRLSDWKYSPTVGKEVDDVL